VSSAYVTVSAVAGAEILHGGPVRVVDGVAMPEFDLDAITGFTKRPLWARGEVSHQPGEDLLVLTDGEQLCAVDQGSRWIRLSKGKIVK
jgi:hypothetical protein